MSDEDQNADASGRRMRPRTRLNPVRACIACRQMKMKCEGAENPPCVKCFKAGRICLPQPRPHDPYQYVQLQPSQQGSDRNLHTPLQQDATNISPQDIASTPRQSAHSGESFNNSLFLIHEHPSASFQETLNGSTAKTLSSSRLEPQTTRSAVPPPQGRGTYLPSIYSASPVDVLDESDHSQRESATSDSQKKRKWSEVHSGGLGFHWTPGMESNPLQSEEELNIPKQDLWDMIVMFREKLLPFIPALLHQDFQEINHLIETEPPLVYCICYVTAPFLPGGSDIQQLLLPRILQILKGIVTNSKNGTCDISTFKGLLILYVYATFPSSNSQFPKPSWREEILYWPLKSLVELYGMRLSLHNSLQDLKTELRCKTVTTVLDTPSFQRYTYWLQLFLMSHYASLVSGNPPSIRIDATIRAAPALMQEIGLNPQMRLFGEVELCLIWENASAHHRELSEWWCPPDPSNVVDDDAIESMLTEADKAIDAWYNKWDEYIRSESALGPILNYLGCCTRFCISSYAVRSIRNSSQGVSIAQKTRVQRCVVCASRVLDWSLNLRPIQKDKLRYVSESGSIMFQFCALFIIASCQAFESSIPNISECLQKVKDAGKLVMTLTGTFRSVRLNYGELIINRAEALEAALEQKRHQESAGTNIVTNSEAQGQGEHVTENHNFSNLNLNNNEILDMDLYWDFSMLLPNTW